MTKRLLILFSVLISLLMASTSTIAAQTPTPDVSSIAKDVLAADPQSLLEGLQTPPSDKDLPEGFSDAQYVDIASDATPVASPVSDDISRDCLYDASSLGQTEGAVGYSIVGDTTALNFPYVCASINYVIFEEGALGKTPLEDFKTGVEQGINESGGEGTPDSQGGIGEVTDTTVAGEDAVLLTYTIEDGGAHVVVQTLALPVGNVFVISLVSVADTSEIDADQIAEYADQLTVAGIAHLGTVVEGVQ